MSELFRQIYHLIIYKICLAILYQKGNNTNLQYTLIFCIVAFIENMLYWKFSKHNAYTYNLVRTKVNWNLQFCSQCDIFSANCKEPMEFSANWKVTSSYPMQTDFSWFNSINLCSFRLVKNWPTLCPNILTSWFHPDLLQKVESTGCLCAVLV